jgi:hypothetical protein
VQVCTSTVNEHVIELFVDFKKAMIRSGGRSCNLDEFGLSVKVVGLIAYVCVNHLVTSCWQMAHFVLRMVCNKERVSCVMKARHVARREEGGLL